MNSSKKAVAYIAMALAVFLAAGIFSAIGNAILTIAGIFDHVSAPEQSSAEFVKEFSQIQNLDIENDAGELQIKTGDSFRVEVYQASGNLRCEDKNGTLVVENRGHAWFGRRSLIVVYLPEDFVARRASIQMGSGRMDIEALNAQNLVIENGAGGFRGQSITAQKADIDCGVGKVSLTGVNLNQLELSGGVGQTELSGVVTGKSKIDGGIGSLALTLKGAENDYAFFVEKGLGSVTIDGEKYSEDLHSRKGAPNAFEIEGGIGRVSIQFE